MRVSVRSYVMAGAAAATATAVALAPLQATPSDVAVPAHATPTTQPHLSQAMVNLLAAASRMTAALPVPKAPNVSGAPAGAAPAAAVTGDVTVQNAASDFVTSAYEYIQDWVNWGVNYGVNIAYWLGDWGVPFASLIGAQVNIIYYSAVVPVADSVVYNLISPVLNNPLNLGVWANGLVDVGWSIVAAAWNTVVAEANYFLGWVLPPLPGPPPISLAATTNLTASATDASQPVNFVTETVTGGISLAYDSLADAGKRLADALQNGLGAEGGLLAGGAIDEGTTLTDAVGEITPAEEIAPAVAKSVEGLGTTLTETAETVSENVEKIAGLASQDGVADVPKSVTQSLTKPDDTTTDKTEASDTKPARSLTRAVRDATTKVAADVKKATDDVRNAVRTIGTAGKKSQESSESDTKSEAKSDTKSDAAKPAKKEQRERPAKNKTEGSSASSE